MQDELKKVISQAMNTNSEFEQEPSTPFAEGELSDEALEAVAGGRCNFTCLFASGRVRNANNLV